MRYVFRPPRHAQSAYGCARSNLPISTIRASQAFEVIRNALRHVEVVRYHFRELLNQRFSHYRDMVARQNTDSYLPFDEISPSQRRIERNRKPLHVGTE